MEYQEEIEKLLQIDSIKEYYNENPYINNGNNYIFYKLLLKQYNYLQQQQEQTQETQETQEIIMQRIEERRKKKEEEDKRRQQEETQAYQKFLQEIAPPPPCKTADQQTEDSFLFIHNARQWQLMKERVKNAVFIDKLLIILSHEFLLYERNTIEIKLQKFLEYLNIEVSKDNIDYIRKNLKSIKNFLIEKEFIESLSIKKSVLIIELSTQYTKELREKRIITKLEKSVFSLSDNAYKLTRVSKFFQNNFTIKDTDLKVKSLFSYVIDTNLSRKREKIKRILDI